MHPTAFSEFVDGQVYPQVGSIVECYYEEAGPQQRGKLRGLRFRNSLVSMPVGYYDYSCLDSDIVGVGSSSFNNSTVSSTGGTGTTSSSRTTGVQILGNQRGPATPTTTSTTKALDRPYPGRESIREIVQTHIDKKDNTAIVVGTKTLMFGDSQIGIWGNEMADYLRTRGSPVAGVFAKASSTSKQWIRSRLFKGTPYPSVTPSEIGLIIISLGGQPGSDRQASELVDKLKSKFDNANIIWVGAIPMAVNGSNKGYNYDRSNPGRKRRAYAMKNMVERQQNQYGSGGVDYINPFEAMGDSYVCTADEISSGVCDGVHLDGERMMEFLFNVGLIDNDWWFR